MRFHTVIAVAFKAISEIIKIFQFFSFVLQWSAVALWAWGKCRQSIYLFYFCFFPFVILNTLNLKSTVNAVVRRYLNDTI